MEVGSKEWKAELAEEAEKVGFSVNPSQIELLSVFSRELLSFNAQFNITAIKDPHELIVKHILDSLIPSRFIPQSSLVLDIGTGGGFPGIPLRIINPSFFMTLVDGSRKKINFVKYAIRTLKLAQIEALHIRAEQLNGYGAFSKKFDVIISRAVTSLEHFASLASPLVKANGMIIAMKGEIKASDTELMDLKKQVNSFQESIENHKFEIQVQTYQLPDLYNKRSLVIIKKL